MCTISLQSVDECNKTAQKLIEKAAREGTDVKYTSLRLQAGKYSPSSHAIRACIIAMAYLCAAVNLKAERDNGSHREAVCKQLDLARQLIK